LQKKLRDGLDSHGPNRVLRVLLQLFEQGLDLDDLRALELEGYFSEILCRLAPHHRERIAGSLLYQREDLAALFLLLI